jgi:hypothetical protein
LLVDLDFTIVSLPDVGAFAVQRYILFPKMLAFDSIFSLLRHDFDNIFVLLHAKESRIGYGTYHFGH